MTEHVQVERRERCLVISLDRQDRLNALSHEMYAAVADGLEQAADDPQIRAVVLTGRGDYFPEELLPETLKTATAIAATAPNAMIESKELIRSGKDAITEQMAREAVHFGAQLKSKEFSESVAAMKEKRLPKFD